MHKNYCDVDIKKNCKMCSKSPSCKTFIKLRDYEKKNFNVRIRIKQKIYVSVVDLEIE